MDNDKIAEAFHFFTEVGIIAQLSAILLERHLPGRLTNTHFGLLSHLSRRPEGSTPQQMAAWYLKRQSMRLRHQLIRATRVLSYVKCCVVVILVTQPKV